MQIPIELTDDQARLLEFYARREKLPEGVLVQHLVEEFLAKKGEEDKKPS